MRASGTGSLVTVRHGGFEHLDTEFGSVADNVAMETEAWAGGLAALAELLPAPVGR